MRHDVQTVARPTKLGGFMVEESWRAVRVSEEKRARRHRRMRGNAGNRAIRSGDQRCRVVDCVGVNAMLAVQVSVSVADMPCCLGRDVCQPTK